MKKLLPQLKNLLAKDIRFFLAALFVLVLLTISGQSQAQVYYVTTASSVSAADTEDALLRVNYDGSSNTTVVSSIAVSPTYSALDLANNRIFVYEAIAANRSIKVLNASTGAVITSFAVLAGINNVNALKYDPINDYIYYLTTDGSALSTAATDALVRVKSDGTGQTVIASSFTPSPLYLALDVANNRAFVYESIAAQRGIKTVSLSSGTITQSATVNTGTVKEIAYDATTDFLYYLTSDDIALNVAVTDALTKVKPDGTNTTVIKSGITGSPVLFALDAGNNRAFIYEGATANKAIKTVDLSSGNVVSILSLSSYTSARVVTAMNVPASAVVTAASVASISSTSATLGGTVTRSESAVTARGVVYSSSNTSPVIGGSGVTQAANGTGTGIFSASITGLSSSTTYYVKAYATSGAGTVYGAVTTFSTLSSDANLSGLSISAGTLTPSFSAGTITYTASVANANSTITVTPTKNNANASIKVNNVTVNSGSASGNISLNVGDNIITTVVTAQDGSTTKTYTLTVNRGKNAQSITFNNLPAKTYGNADFSPGATASSGLTVSYSSDNTAVATIVSGNIHIVGAGTANITASQTGDVNTLAASNVVQALSVSKAAITATANAQTKTYGDNDPTFTYSVTSGALVSGDTFAGTLTRTDAGVNIGAYAITQGTLALSANYNLTFVGANLTINKRPITMKPVSLTKVYGDTEPFRNAFSLTAGSIASTDGTSGQFGRIAGEGVGTYAVTLGGKIVVNISNSTIVTNNYDITLEPVNFTITAKPITVTANAQTKTYGDADPTLTYGTSTALISGDAFSGALTRATGEGFGTYAISQGTLTLSSNYTLSFTGANLTIGKKTVNVTANVQTKTYGDADPTFTYTADALVSGDSFTGSLTRDAGETVGSHAINQGSLALNSNYTLNFTGANLTIGAKSVNVTANAQTKTYGDADPTLTYTADALVSGDSFTGSLTRDAGETVGSHAINQGSLALNSNYTLNFTGANLTIGAKSVNVTANAQTKTYGDADPTLTYTADALVSGDSFDGSLTRDAGETVGSHAINQGSLALNSNYTLNFTGANLTIGAKTVNVTANAQTKTYGDADPTLTYTADALVSGDSFDGSLTRDAGETVGSHAINQGSLALNSNYTLNFTGANLTIGKKTVNVTANAQTKTYGDADPALTYTAGALVSGDSFTGSLTRDAGETLGSYAINQGSLALNSNYTLNFTGANLSIGVKVINVTANALTKTYGAADPVFTYTADPLVGSDTFTGSLTRIAGSNVGSYAIKQGAFTAGSNYTINFTGANFTIGKKIVNVTANARTKSYGDADPIFTYTADPLVGSDTFTGALTRIAGETLGTYAINQGALALNGNYTLNFTGANLTIGKKVINVTAIAKTKTYGDADPVFTYTADPLVGSDTFTGSLTRISGENIGSYGIKQGVFTAGSNYTINYTEARIAITKRNITFNANVVSVQYGDTAPALGYTLSGTLAVVDNVTGALSRAPGSTIGTYPISQNTLSVTNSGNYNISFIGNDFNITTRPVTIAANVINKTYGDADPGFTYHITSGSLLSGDAITGSLVRDAGEAAGMHAINQGTITINSSNYNLTFQPAYLEIGRAPLTITADNKAKVAGQAIPTLTYAITGFKNGDDESSFTTPVSIGTTANSSSPAGNYPINVSNATNSNYDFNFVSGTLTVTPASTNANLASLTVNEGAISPAFNANTLDYTMLVANTQSGITLTPTVVDATATITVNGSNATSGASVAISVYPGENPIPVTVTAQDGITTKNYMLTVTRAYETISTLSALTVTNGTLSPAFTTAGHNYTVSVANTVESIALSPVATSTYGLIKINGATVETGFTPPRSLNVGENIFNIEVFAQDRSISETYVVKVTRAASNNATLASLTISPNSVLAIQQNTPSLVEYTTSVSTGTTSITLTPTVKEANATMTINGSPILSGVTSNSIPLNTGTTTADIIVKAQDGVTTRTYRVTINRTGSNIAGLSSISVTPTSTLTVQQSTNSLVEYSTSVSNAIASIRLTSTLKEANGSITVNGSPVLSGVASDPILLNVGVTNINVVATAQDGVTTKTYTIAVTRAGSNIASLTHISIFPGSVLAIQQNTSSQVTYTTTVSPGTASIKLTPALKEANATMTINGTPALSGVISDPIPLNVGTNTVNIVVTAQNGITIKTYTITVTRPSSFMVDRADSKLLFANKAVNPMDPTDNDGVVVHQGVSPNGDGSNDFLSIEGISAYSGNKLSIMNANGALVFETKDYGKNSSNLFDGHSNKNGALLKPGTYFYSLEYKAGKEKRKTGYIILKY
jgi:gliding motility-associated-like protein